jgi:hypothetical protein
MAFGVIAACADRMSGIGIPARINSMVNQRLSGAWRGRTSRELFLWNKGWWSLAVVPSIPSISFVMSMFLLL